MLDSSDKQKVIKFIKASLNTELKSMLLTRPNIFLQVTRSLVLQISGISKSSCSTRTVAEDVMFIKASLNTETEVRLAQTFTLYGPTYITNVLSMLLKSYFLCVSVRPCACSSEVRNHLT